MKEKYLPIGTVVLLKDATKKLMITGYCSMLPDDQTKIYDYVGMMFPEGNVAGEEMALFDHEQIVSVEHMGLVNEEYKEFNNNLINAMKEEVSSFSENKNSFIPDNLNQLIKNISLDSVKQSVLEPTAFDSDKIKVPSFEMQTPSLKVDDDVSITVEEGFSDKDISIDTDDSGDGNPVLQLEPIFVDKNINNDDSSGNDAGIFQLERL